MPTMDTKALSSTRAVLAAIESWFVLEDLAKCGLVPQSDVEVAQERYVSIVSERDKMLRRTR